MLDLTCTHSHSPSLKVEQLEKLLIYLKQVHQIDLTGYKRPSLLRRTQLRMQQVGVECYQDYFDQLQQQPDEVTHLVNTVLVNFTCFFRDRPVWDYLINHVIPHIITSKAPNEPIRIWSAGCASGEEAYSLAMLLAEMLGPEQFLQRVRIYGTDVDQDAIRQAHKGCYSAAVAEEIPPVLLGRYFEPTPEGYRWRPDYCPPILFHPHDLIQTAPMPKIDLLVCRNLLMYLTSETQVRALVRFHFSLQPTGFLLLGQAESLIAHPQASLFKPTYRQTKVFQKVPNALHSVIRSLGSKVTL
ncbi:MAG: protein-glutamate O-methyltransferase CheR [Oculatellaceae cyanobacterium bins.114]|nr:protein-glutamate O-methyltransferase CheR [Oculatellaceae cyanobacterium bins.114]